MPAGDDAIYSMAKLRGRSAAAISSQQADEAAQGSPALEPLRHRRGRRRHRRQGRARRAARCSPGPFDVMDAGRMAVVAEPSGAALCLWEPGKSIGAEVVNEPGAMSWADLATTDAPAAQAFLHGAAGLALRADERDAAVLGDLQRRAQPGRDDGAAAPACPRTGSRTSWSTTSRRAGQIAQETGGTPFLGPIEVPGGGRFSLIADPQGAPFGILQGEMDD